MPDILIAIICVFAVLGFLQFILFSGICFNPNPSKDVVRFEYDGFRLIWEMTSINIFGKILVSILYIVLAYIFAFISLMYLLCTIGKKENR